MTEVSNAIKYLLKGLCIAGEMYRLPSLSRNLHNMNPLSNMFFLDTHTKIIKKNKESIVKIFNKVYNVGTEKEVKVNEMIRFLFDIYLKTIGCNKYLSGAIIGMAEQNKVLKSNIYFKHFFYHYVIYFAYKEGDTTKIGFYSVTNKEFLYPKDNNFEELFIKCDLDGELPKTEGKDKFVKFSQEALKGNYFKFTQLRKALMTLVSGKEKKFPRNFKTYNNVRKSLILVNLEKFCQILQFYFHGSGYIHLYKHIRPELFDLSMLGNHYFYKVNRYFYSKLGPFKSLRRDIRLELKKKNKDFQKKIEHKSKEYKKKQKNFFQNIQDEKLVPLKAELFTQVDELKIIIDELLLKLSRGEGTFDNSRKNNYEIIKKKLELIKNTPPILTGIGRNQENSEVNQIQIILQSIDILQDLEEYFLEKFIESGIDDDLTTETENSIENSEETIDSNLDLDKFQQEFIEENEEKKHMNIYLPPNFNLNLEETFVISDEDYTRFFNIYDSFNTIYSDNQINARTSPSGITLPSDIKSQIDKLNKIPLFKETRYEHLLNRERNNNIDTMMDSEVRLTEDRYTPELEYLKKEYFVDVVMATSEDDFLEADKTDSKGKYLFHKPSRRPTSSLLGGGQIGGFNGPYSIFQKHRRDFLENHFQNKYEISVTDLELAFGKTADTKENKGLFHGGNYSIASQKNYLQLLEAIGEILNYDDTDVGKRVIPFEYPKNVPYSDIINKYVKATEMKNPINKYYTRDWTNVRLDIKDPLVGLLGLRNATFGNLCHHGRIREIRITQSGFKTKKRSGGGYQNKIISKKGKEYIKNKGIKTLKKKYKKNKTLKKIKRNRINKLKTQKKN